MVFNIFLTTRSTYIYIIVCFYLILISYANENNIVMRTNENGAIQQTMNNHMKNISYYGRKI